jgi:hypothetical protein
MIKQVSYTAAGANDSRTAKFDTRDTELSEAVDRVYRKYGNDLSAFYRDVKKSITVEKSEGERPKKTGTSD